MGRAPILIIPVQMALVHHLTFLRILGSWVVTASQGGSDSVCDIKSYGGFMFSDIISNSVLHILTYSIKNTGIMIIIPDG